MNIEIERKFLLKAIPNKKPIETIEIFQWYLKNSEGIWERARSCYSNINGFYFTHTIKKSIAPGVSEEDEKSITSDEFNQFLENCKESSLRFIEPSVLNLEIKLFKISFNFSCKLTSSDM